MNIYDLHLTPEGLHGFDIAPYKMPALAYELAKKNPELRSKLEPVIIKDPHYAFLYAYSILKRRWPEAEPHIMKDPEWAYMYTKYVLERRWPEAEPYIMKAIIPAFNYAAYILKRRWPEAEPYIMKDPSWWNAYKREFKL